MLPPLLTLGLPRRGALTLGRRSTSALAPTRPTRCRTSDRGPWSGVIDRPVLPDRPSAAPRHGRLVTEHVVRRATGLRAAGGTGCSCPMITDTRSRNVTAAQARPPGSGPPGRHLGPTGVTDQGDTHGVWPISTSADPGNFVAGVPHEWFAYLRREAPVYWHPDARRPRPTASGPSPATTTASRSTATTSTSRRPAQATFFWDFDEDDLAQQQHDDAQHGPAAAHPLPAPGQQGLHPPDGPRPRGQDRHAPPTPSSTRSCEQGSADFVDRRSRPSCPSRSSPTCWACPRRTATWCSTGPTG